MIIPGRQGFVFPRATGRMDDDTADSAGCYETAGMKPLEKVVYQNGKIGYALLWLLGVPLPILLIIYLVRGH